MTREAAGRLAILSRPGDEWLAEEVTAWREAGISIVVSLLEAHEQAELGLVREADECRAQAIRFLSFPIADRGSVSLMRKSASPGLCAGRKREPTASPPDIDFGLDWTR